MEIRARREAALAQAEGSKGDTMGASQSTSVPAAGSAAPAAPQAPGAMLRLTPQELAQFDGSDPSKPLYIAIRGKIYDVSASRQFYGPGGLCAGPGCVGRGSWG